MEYGGSPLVARAVALARAGGCGRVHVVTGAGAERARAAGERAGAAPQAWVRNPAWETGMGSSLRAGLASLAGTGARAALVLLVDQPGITPEAVARVLGAYEGPATLASAAYGGERGHPVLLGAAHWAGAGEAATGDQGARAYLRERAVRFVECGDLCDPYDIDTPEDLERLPGHPAREVAPRDSEREDPSH
ncbi:4-diphosphocytidyl-2C-methyl-D-erythritol synthase [Streptomyces sp. SPB074]|nr:4-diphosphocytidyl-2C-methyl-D-erythritol synthase [Streptomyces sp. SPB074]